jgi:hypothetical protein
MLISMGQRLKQVAQEAQVQMISLSRISSPAPNCSFLMISEGEDDDEVVTGQPFVHFLHCRQALIAIPDIALICSLIPRLAAALLIFIGIGWFPTPRGCLEDPGVQSA